MVIKRIDKTEKTEAAKLVWNVFLKFEAPDYTDDGIRMFRDFISSQEVLDELEMYAAYENGKMVGVLATRKNGSHIALLFVDESCHKRGIGRSLFNTALKNTDSQIITVNSSPYAREFYHKLGFTDTSVEQTDNGIRFTPMQYLRV